MTDGNPPSHENPSGVSSIELGDVFFRWVMGMRPIVVRSAGAAVAVVLGVAGTRWGAQGALAAIAASR
jgi:hypothetical protein